MKTTVLAIVPVLLVSQVNAQTPGDIIVTKTHLDQTEQPLSVTDVLGQCAQDPACNTAINAAAAYVGVDASVVTSAIALTADIRTEGQEEKYISYVLPPGYEYCRSSFQFVSAVPKTGDRASLFAANAFHDRINAMTWTPKEGFMGGRSWMEFYITLVGVKSSVAKAYRDSGQCNANVEHEIVRCKGGEGVNKGIQSCGNYTD